MLKGVTPKKKQNKKTHNKICTECHVAHGSAVYIGDGSEQRAQRGATFLYNWSVFCFSFLSFFHSFVLFCFGFACFFLIMDKTCSSPHDCGCFGERYRSMMCYHCIAEHHAVRQMFRLFL